jgi:hypothetical protein
MGAIAELWRWRMNRLGRAGMFSGVFYFAAPQSRGGTAAGIGRRDNKGVSIDVRGAYIHDTIWHATQSDARG